DLLCAEISHLDHVIVESFEGLVVEYCQAHGVSVLVRGVRTASDFEYEASMAQTNYLLDSSIETMFLMPSEEYTFLSSRLVREVYAAGGSLPRFVSPRVDERLIHKLRK
ncbi:MAG: pantetheine-phosphate adenylyltransferase, partial [Planctomycetes bacterium]|nr:pantetheine-phosphate adenylyltransferase [Planctomycetota bacterium]